MVKAKKIIKKKTKQRKEKKSRPPRIFIDRNGKPYVMVSKKEGVFKYKQRNDKQTIS